MTHIHPMLTEGNDCRLHELIRRLRSERRLPSEEDCFFSDAINQSEEEKVKMRMEQVTSDE